MKLFNDFDAVKFPEENLIFITHSGFIYYIYNSKHKYWIKHRNAGNDHITLANYPDVSREELKESMNGVFPQRETDFMRLCPPSQLWIRDMLDILKEDYSMYMSDASIHHAIHELLLESDICYKSFENVKKLLNQSVENSRDSQHLLEEIINLSVSVTGRDIFKQEIRIVDGHDSSSYFWIRPARVIDESDTNGIDNVAEMKSIEISIEEDDVDQYLTPFLYKHFDEKLEANTKRMDGFWPDEDGTEQPCCISGFEWYLTHNFFTFQSISAMLQDIRDTISALYRGEENEFTEKLKIKRGSATYKLVYAKDLSPEQIDEYNANRPETDDTEIDLIIDFYNRFIYRMEYMMKVGNEKGYNLISFMGP